jgi:hypothetical protein
MEESEWQRWPWRLEKGSRTNYNSGGEGGEEGNDGARLLAADGNTIECEENLVDVYDTVTLEEEGASGI